jgi:prophage regulatory protein
MQHVSLLRIADVSARVGLRRSQIYRLIARGEFPTPVRLSVRTSAWRSDEIDTWIAERERVFTPSSFRATSLGGSAASPTSTR